MNHKHLKKKVRKTVLFPPSLLLGLWPFSSFLILSHPTSSLFVPQKSCCLTYKLIYKLWGKLIVGLCSQHFHQRGDSFANETPARSVSQPCGETGWLPIVPQHGSVRAGERGEGPACSSRLALKQILFNSGIIFPLCLSELEHQITLKLPWQ